MAELSPAALKSQRGSGDARLPASSLDDIGRAVLLLATEMAVLADRQRVLEAVLEERGIEVTDAVRNHQPDGALAVELSAERQRLARAIVEALCPPGA